MMQYKARLIIGLAYWDWRNDLYHAREKTSVLVLVRRLEQTIEQTHGRNSQCRHRY